MKVVDLVTKALRDIGVKSRGVTLSPDDLQETFEELNEMLDDWSADNLAIFQITHEDLSLSLAQAEYSIGSGGNFNTVRPESIEGCYIRDANGTDYWLDPMTDRQYRELAVKDVSARPTRFYYEKSHPLGRFYFDSVRITTETFHLDSLKPLTQFADINATVDLPSGYKTMLRKNLAVRRAPAYNKTPSPILLAEADASMNKIKTRNRRPGLLQVDRGLQRGRPYDINTG